MVKEKREKKHLKANLYLFPNMASKLYISHFAFFLLM